MHFCIPSHGAPSNPQGIEAMTSRHPAAQVESEVNGDKRAQYYLQFLRSLFEHRVDEAAALAKPTSADPARLEPALGAILQSLKVLYGYQALLEDDPETFAPMVDPSSTIAAR